MPSAPAQPSFFIDHDGRVFLVRDAGVLRLPHRGEVGFAFAEKHRGRVLGHEVVFGSPLDKHHRLDWPWKDDLPGMSDADPMARTAANLSQTRIVAKLALRRGAQVLLIKDKVGFYKHKWSLPGGYLDYGETPEACAAREALEEVGLKVEVERLLRIDSQVVPTGYHFLTFHYQGRSASDALKLKPDEVEDARWAGLSDAAQEVASPHSRLALEGLLREERRS
jgi:8-oxo-dGTP diphosphatase